jgi:hypothetical protein
MFTVYIDDSGTDPNQKLAVASAMIFPNARIQAMEREWSNFKAKENFSCFHMSEFVASNPKSEFAGWDEQKKQRVFDRVKQIVMKYTVQGYSFAVNKKDYDDIVVGDWRACFGGHHYTWGLRHALARIYDWRVGKPIPPLQCVFDWMGKPSDPRRKEIEEVLEMAELMSLEDGRAPGEFTNYSFGHLRDIAGLQCVDMVGWISYQVGLRNFGLTTKPVYPFVQQAESIFQSGKGNILIFTVTRENLADWFGREKNFERTQRFIRTWRQRKEQNEHAGKIK